MVLYPLQYNVPAVTFTLSNVISPTNSLPRVSACFCPSVLFTVMDLLTTPTNFTSFPISAFNTIVASVS